MFRIDRRLIQNFDWLSFFTVLAISIIGIMTIYSGTRPPAEAAQSPLFLKQIVWLLIGIAAMTLFLSFDYIWLSRVSVHLYIAGVILLLIVMISGKSGMGAQRWISLGPIAFQPSEFFKLLFIIMTAGYLSLFSGKIDTVHLLKIFFVLVFIPFVLLFKQPDLGTAVVIVIIFIAMVMAHGLKKKALLLIIAVSIVSLPFVGNIVWSGLKSYQKNRLVAFVDPEADPSGIGYQINQSKVAIGSGGFIGKGFLKGTQGPFRFLPERHTDFIFAVYSEEWGFLGALALLSLYFILIMRGLDTATKAKDTFGKMLALGITFMFSVYFFVNVGMTLGIMPVVGIPLPFMSYGGTALLSNFISLGVLMNVRTRRFNLFY
ncbi:MAG: rod shape-determining protein RodA [Nitrospirae bacterium]|nr:rod shape-determining protein RodA [Nitrospirota bacterium]